MQIIHINLKNVFLILYYLFLNFLIKTKTIIRNLILDLKIIKNHFFRKNVKTQIEVQTLITNHIYVIYPNIENFLNKVFVNFQDKNFSVLKNSNISLITIDSNEFKTIAEKYFDNLKRMLGKTVYRQIEEYWGEEEFKEFVILWLYYRISRELLSNIQNLIEKNV